MGENESHERIDPVTNRQLLAKIAANLGASLSDEVVLVPVTDEPVAHDEPTVDAPEEPPQLPKRR